MDARAPVREGLAQFIDTDAPDVRSVAHCETCGYTGCLAVAEGDGHDAV